MDIQFQILDKESIPSIIPLIQEFTDHKFSDEVLCSRFEAMFTQNYECLGMLYEEKLIGVCGLWFQTRHYAGLSCEPDHVFILPQFQGQGLGDTMFEYIAKYCKGKGCESLELNTYVHNTASHKFYYNQGFKILGYHFFKDL